MARILILIGAHLCMAPRPVKEADVLAAAGHQVEILGIAFDAELTRRDRMLSEGRPWRYSSVVDLRAPGSGRLRLRRRLATEAWRRIRVAHPAAFGYASREMLRVARNTRADLTIAHSESTLWIATQLRRERRRVGVDFEDWFSEDLPLESRAGRPTNLLRRWERDLARDCAYVLAPSESMAAELAKAYDAPHPAVVRNIFPPSSPVGHAIVKDRSEEKTPSLHWFSQTMGPGRGLETLFEALKLVRSPVQVHLRGRPSPGFVEVLRHSAGEDVFARVHIHETVPASELAARIAEHDIGLALEDPAIRSRDLTITNKVFQYLQGGLALIATRTRGQEEVFRAAPEVGELIPAHDAPALARAIDALAGDSARLARARAAATHAGTETFAWNREAAVLLARGEQALATR